MRFIQLVSFWSSYQCFISGDRQFVILKLYVITGKSNSPTVFLIIMIILLLLLSSFFLSQAFNPRDFSWTEGYSHRSGLHVHTAALSVWCVMFSCSKYSCLMNTTIGYLLPLLLCYDGVLKIFRNHAVKITNLTTKRGWKLPTSTQPLATWHTDSLDIVVLLSAGSSRYNCCIDGGTSPEYFGYTFLLAAAV
jgi:hypothetical protein